MKLNMRSTIRLSIESRLITDLNSPILLGKIEIRRHYIYKRENVLMNNDMALASVPLKVQLLKLSSWSPLLCSVPSHKLMFSAA